jgi:hypothetical protein
MVFVVVMTMAAVKMKATWTMPITGRAVPMSFVCAIETEYLMLIDVL